MLLRKHNNNYLFVVRYPKLTEDFKKYSERMEILGK